MSSQESRPAARVEPFMVSGDLEQAIATLSELVGSIRGARIITSTPTYLHVEFRSLVFRFVDDLELLADPEAGVVHVRSASRLGTSDLGANRRRVEELRRRFLGQRAHAAKR